MSRAFSIPTVLRMVPNCLLRDFFQRLHLGHLPIPWDDLNKRQVGQIVEVLNTLSRPQLDRVEAALHNVFDLACETGVGALIEAGVICGDLTLAADMPQEGGPYHKAMWAWLNRPEVVDAALMIHQVDHLAWWRKRSDLPKVSPDQSPGTLTRLEKELSDLLLWEQGRGKVCTIETLARGGTDYFFAYPDDFVQNVTAHDDEGKLEPRTFRQTFSIVFAFNREEGTLELFAKVPSKLRPRIEALFGKVVLKVDLGEWKPPAAYQLSCLKSRAFSLATDPKDCVSVRIRRLRLAFNNSDRRLILEADPGGPPDDVYLMMDEVLDKERVPLSSVSITLATFTFEFLAKGDRKEGTLTFDVAPPNSCSLKSQRPERIEIAAKYLKRWKIDVA